MTSEARYRWIFILYGFLKACKPSESFLVPYLIQDKGLTREQVDHHVFPVWTYSYFLWIVPITLLAERFGYRWVIWLESLAHLATRWILIYGEGLVWMQIQEVTFSLAMAGELVYYSYVYKVFPQADMGARMTSFSRASVLAGHCVGALLAQVLSLSGVSWRTLFWISLGSVCLACIVSCFFPVDHQVDHSIEDREAEVEDFVGQVVADAQVYNIYAATEDDDEDGEDDGNKDMEKQALLPGSSPSALALVPALVTLTIPFLMYSLHKTHLYNVESFSHILWYKLLEEAGREHDRSKLLNGLADVGSRSVAAVGAILAWYLLPSTRETRHFVRCSLLTSSLAVITGLTYAQAILQNIEAAYLVFVVSIGLSGMVASLTATWLAEKIAQLPFHQNRRGYAIVFGMATLLCTGVQSLMQLILGQLDVPIVGKFWVYAAFISVLSVVSFAAFWD